MGKWIIDAQIYSSVLMYYKDHQGIQQEKGVTYFQEISCVLG